MRKCLTRQRPATEIKFTSSQDSSQELDIWEKYLAPEAICSMEGRNKVWWWNMNIPNGGEQSLTKIPHDTAKSHVKSCDHIVSHKITSFDMWIWNSVMWNFCKEYPMEHRLIVSVYLIVSVPDEEIEDIIPTVSQILCSDSATRRFSRVTKTPGRLKPVHFVSDYQIIRMTLVQKVRWLTRANAYN